MRRTLKTRGDRSGFAGRRPDLAPCLQMTDTSTSTVSASWLSQSKPGQGNAPQEARLAQQFVQQNRGILQDYGVETRISYDGAEVTVRFRATTNVGALPLLSPVSGKADLGLVISPRFGWGGIGPAMATMGWRVLPTPLPLSLLPRSARSVPPWVLSTAVLFRLERLLQNTHRRFASVQADLHAPRGTVDWEQYATQRMPRARFLDIPCQFPDLRDDRDLKGAIHHVLLRQSASLETQRNQGTVVVRLLEWCAALLREVRDCPPRRPSALQIRAWYEGPLKSRVFRDGLEAIEWTLDQRGLAGLSDLQGLPWIMSMEAFFEAWVETVAVRVARSLGAVIRTGRQRQTVAPLVWEPPYTGSQRSIVPDIVLEGENATIIVDAKYKEHWSEIAVSPWMSLGDEIRDRHREDLLQVLAYANTASTPEVTCVLVYPCEAALWESLKEQHQTAHAAELRAGSRRVRVILTGMPLHPNAIPEVADQLTRQLRP